MTGACLHEDRCSHAPAVDVAVAKHHDTSGNPAWERALVPRPPLPKKGRHRNATFFWDVKPTSLMMEGTFYMDGSCFEGNIAELARCGWGFVCINEAGEIVGSALARVPRGLMTSVVPKLGRCFKPRSLQFRVRPTFGRTVNHC